MHWSACEAWLIWPAGGHLLFTKYGQCALSVREPPPPLLLPGACLILPERYVYSATILLCFSLSVFPWNYHYVYIVCETLTVNEVISGLYSLYMSSWTQGLIASGCHFNLTPMPGVTLIQIKPYTTVNVYIFIHIQNDLKLQNRDVREAL